MSLSIREQIVQEVITRLTGANTPCSMAYRSRIDLLDATELPCWDVTAESEKVSLSTDPADHDCVVRVLTLKVRAVRPMDDDGEAALDPYYCFAVGALCDGECNLGGLVYDISEVGNEVVSRPDGREFVGMEMEFAVKFTTRRDDPAQKEQ